MVERGVFLGWSVICRDEGVRYHSRVTALRGKQQRLSPETADKEEQNTEISLCLSHLHVHKGTLSLVSTSTGKYKLHMSSRWNPQTCLRSLVSADSQLHG